MSVLPAEVAALVERFYRNRDAHRSPGYNEAQTRREFIDPLFRALGWDLANVAGLAEAYKDVIHEDAIKVGGASKAARHKVPPQPQAGCDAERINGPAYETCGQSDEKVCVVQGATQV